METFTKEEFEDTYNFERDLGDGAYGTVSLYTHETTGNAVAIKSFKDHEDRHDLEYFQHEVDMLRRLQGPHILQFHAAFIVDHGSHPCYVIVTEFVPSDLLDYVFEADGLAEELIRLLMFQLLTALEFIRSQGYMHLDVKPKNILVDPHDMSLKLCDFGSTRALGDIPKINPSTVPYRSYRSCVKHEYTHANDIWAAGCTMFFMYKKRMMFENLESNLNTQIRMISVFPNMIDLHKPIKLSETLSPEANAFFDSLFEVTESDMTAGDCLLHPFFDAVRR